MRFIGITTFEDITRHLDSHTRFLRRFNRIDIEEPSQQETIDILNGVKSNIEQYHDISFSDDVTERAVKLSKRFLSNKALPDSAIDILDEAGAYRELNPINGNTTQIIDKDLIDTIVAQLGNVKNKIIDDNDTSQLRNLSENMRKSIFGQDQAIKQVVDAVLTARAGLTDNHKPQSCLLFVGPTGRCPHRPLRAFLEIGKISKKDQKTLSADVPNQRVCRIAARKKKRYNKIVIMRQPVRRKRRL